jgi:nitrous oxide reductase
MKNSKTTRREFIKNSVITGAVTGTVLTASGSALAKTSSDATTSVAKNRDVPVLNQANMFDLAEAYGWLEHDL